MCAVMMSERLRDRVEAILPTRKEFARSSEEIGIWLGTPADTAAKACTALKRFGAVDFYIDFKKIGNGKQVVSRKMWWGVD
jgi:hypothetical protein